MPIGWARGNGQGGVGAMWQEGVVRSRDTEDGTARTLLFSANASEAHQQQLSVLTSEIQALRLMLAAREQTIRKLEIKLAATTNSTNRSHERDDVNTIGRGFSSAEHLPGEREQVFEDQPHALPELARSLSELETHLTTIQHSFSWLVLQRLRRLRFALAPGGSRRDRLIRFALDGLVRCKREGLAAVLGRVFHWFRSTRSPAAESRSAHGLAHERPRLRVDLAQPLPERLTLGGGQSFCVMGWVSHAPAPVSAVTIVAKGLPLPIWAQRLGRSTHRAFERADDPRPPGVDCAFVALVPVPPDFPAATLRAEIKVHLKDGSVHQQILGDVDIERRADVGASPPAKTEEPLVAVCMATYNPPADLFVRQIESIRNQTYRNWVCVISDDGSAPAVRAEMRRVLAGDPRFRVSEGGGRLGFYHNFERALSLAPPEAEFLAMCDQDDWWRPDKLAALLSAFDSETTLVYSDMRIVDRSGKVLADTFWQQRPNAWDNLGSLLLANTITGAASMFRRPVLERAMPFPPRIADMFHDHWIAAVSLALGKVRFVNRPLHDYVQHGDNVIGHAACQPANQSLRQCFADLLCWCRLGRLNWFLRDRSNAYKAIFYMDVLRIRQLAQALELRCGDRLQGAKRRGVRRLARPSSLLSMAWFALRGLARLGRKSETLGAEWRLLGAALWCRTIQGLTRLGDCVRGQRRPALPSGSPSAEPCPESAIQPFDYMLAICDKIAALKLAMECHGNSSTRVALGGQAGSDGQPTSFRNTVLMIENETPPVSRQIPA